MAILNNNPLVGASGNQGGYNINNSLRFRSSASAYLTRTPSSTPTSFTISVWLKRGTLSAYQSIMYSRLAGSSVAGGNNGLVFDANNAIVFSVNSADAGKTTTAVFRDPSAWYHIVVNYNGSGTSAIYVNGVQQTTTGSNTGTNKLYNSTGGTNAIGRYGDDSSAYFDGYMAEFNFIDGSVKTPSDFGETDTTTGVWKPKAYTGTYGTNGFYLKFSDIATTSGSNAGLGKDFSGNSNYWTTNNISVTAGTTYDAMTDVPTNTSATVANYATLNPLSIAGNTNVSMSGANLNVAIGAAGQWRQCVASMAMRSGKYYFEVTSTTNSGAAVGIVGTTDYINGFSLTGYTANGYGYITDGTKMNNGSAVSYGATWTTNDVIGVAFDADNGTLTFYKNNASQGTAYTATTGIDYYPSFSGVQGSTVLNVNFGQRPFSYTPPTGFVALNTYNLPTPTILQGNKYMDATLYTGVGATQTITGYNFQPELVWVKARSAAYDHKLVDVVRGLSGSIYRDLESNTTDAEGTPSDGISSLNSDGFTITGGGNPGYNGNTTTFVAWAWDAGSSTVTNTSGSISSQVRANTTAGFSIVTYTGTGALGTVGHGLGVAPSMLIIKSRSAIDTWRVYHASLGNTKYINLNDTSAAGTASTVWNNTSPTSSVFTINTESSVNGSGRTQVAYCWAEIAGFSKFGSYTGNGSTDGPMIYCNFSPKFFLVKRTDTVESWHIVDTSRNTYNQAGANLYPNLSNAESTNNSCDILSNGIKLRNTWAGANANGGTYIFMAFASNPFKNSLAR